MYILWLNLAFGILTAALYYKMGRAFSQRKATGDGQWAIYGFSIWWFALAINAAMGVGATLWQWTVGWNASAFAAYLLVVYLVIFYGLSGLQYYLTYLVSGWWRSWVPVLGYYLAMFAFTAYLIDLTDVQHVYLDEHLGTVRMDAGVDLAGTMETTIFGLGLIMPVLLGAAVYASFYFGVKDRSQRFRIAMVSVGFLVWFGVGLVGSLMAETSLQWSLFSKAIALIAIWMNFQAFQPSKWLQKRWDIHPF